MIDSILVVQPLFDMDLDKSGPDGTPRKQESGWHGVSDSIKCTPLYVNIGPCHDSAVAHVVQVELTGGVLQYLQLEAAV